MSARFEEKAGSDARPILIVDDELDDARLIKRVINILHPHLEVKTLLSGKELLAYLGSDNVERHPPRAIILDLRMPHMDGFSVMEWLLRSPFANIPVIVVSGHDELSSLNRAYALRARTFLVKPVTVESFRNVLHSLNIGDYSGVLIPTQQPASKEIDPEEPGA